MTDEWCKVWWLVRESVVGIVIPSPPLARLPTFRRQRPIKETGTTSIAPYDENLLPSTSWRLRESAEGEKEKEAS